MRRESDEYDEEEVDGYDEDEDDHSATCPKDGSSLFEDNCEYYCCECGQFYCPYCLRSCDPLQGDTANVCEHYVASKFDDDLFDELSRDSGLLPFYKAKATSENKPPENLTDLPYGFGEVRQKRVAALLASVSESDQLTRFGPLYPYMSVSEFFVFTLESTCEALRINIKQAYQDNIACPTFYFAEIGGNQAWDIIRPALQQYVDGQIWLATQITPGSMASSGALSPDTSTERHEPMSPTAPAAATSKAPEARGGGQPAPTTATAQEPELQSAARLKPGFWNYVGRRLSDMINGTTRAPRV